MLHPQMQLLLTLVARLAGPSPVVPTARRTAFRRSQRTINGRLARVARVSDLTVPTPASNLSARHYRPGTPGRPLLVYFHGGGFVVGDLDTHDSLCRFLCHTLDAHILSVGYRLAPEHPFPAAVDDADAAFGWAAEHAVELGADPSRVGIGGDSAGGNLATGVSLLRVAGPVRPEVQLLLYPATDRTRPYPSLATFSDGFLLSAADIARYTEWYAPGLDLTDPRLSPLLAPRLRGLPPAVVVTAAFDPLRDEGEAYAAALVGAGVPVQQLRYPLLHGFANLIGVSSACRQAMTEVAETTRSLWEINR